MKDPRPTPRPSDYHKLAIGEKREHALEQVRELPLRCPWCETSLMPADVLEHAASRCPGPRDPHRGARWLTHREATALMPRATLNRLVSSGVVRTRGPARARGFLQRDIVLSLVWRQKLARGKGTRWLARRRER